MISPTDEVNEILVSRETSEITSGVRLIDLMKRPQLGYDALKNIDKTRPELDRISLNRLKLKLSMRVIFKNSLNRLNK